jgi:hypothetical protein
MLTFDADGELDCVVLGAETGAGAAAWDAVRAAGGFAPPQATAHTLQQTMVPSLE